MRYGPQRDATTEPAPADCGAADQIFSFADDFFLLFLFFSHSKQPAHGRHQSTDDGGAKINLRRKKIEERTPAERGGIERHFSIETRFPFKELARNL